LSYAIRKKEEIPTALKHFFVLNDLFSAIILFQLGELGFNSSAQSGHLNRLEIEKDLIIDQLKY
jgi:hypothetical protein